MRMKNLRAWQKLMVMGTIAMLPFAAVVYKWTTSISLDVEFARQEIRGLQFYAPLLALLKNLQQHRDMTVGMLSGDASFGEALDRKRVDIESDLERVSAVDRQLNASLRTTAKWTALSAETRDLLDRGRSLSAAESFELHTKTIEGLIALITDVGDVSHLTLDPDIDSYYVMNILIFQGPELAEVLAQARGLGGAVAANRKATPEQLQRLDRLATLTPFLQQRMEISVAKASQSNPSIKTELDSRWRRTVGSALDAVGQVATLVSTRGSDTDPRAYFAAASTGVDSIFEMQERGIGTLTRILNDRIAGFQREIISALAWVGLGLLVVGSISLYAIRDVTVSLRQVVEIANQIAAGNVAVQQVSTDRRDEIGILGQAFDRMSAALRDMVTLAGRIAAGDLAVTVTPRSDHDMLGRALADMVERLSALVGDVQQSGIQVNVSVNQIAATARQQQATASAIAATTNEIGATSTQISATSKELVKTMSEVSGVAELSATLANSGQAGLTRMEDTMRHVMDAAGSINAKLTVLNQKAGNINQVVTTITKVADQTNLLSLNAAIEAEKAGEYGRGFAVVATEIRRLADQTAVATDDIELIVKEVQSAVSAGVMGMDKFADEVRRGMQEVQQVGEQLSQIIHHAQTLAPRLEVVTEGMQAQATGAEQITQALTLLGEAAQRTVESLRQSSHVVDGLNQAATGMRSGVSRFRLVA
jgi:methyl-accepting chemotaxis protein